MLFAFVVLVLSSLPAIMATGGVKEGQRALCHGPKDATFYHLVRHCGMASLGLFRLFGHAKRPLAAGPPFRMAKGHARTCVALTRFVDGVGKIACGSPLRVAASGSSTTFIMLAKCFVIVQLHGLCLFHLLVTTSCCCGFGSFSWPGPFCTCTHCQSSVGKPRIYVIKEMILWLSL